MTVLLPLPLLLILLTIISTALSIQTPQPLRLRPNTSLAFTSRRSLIAMLPTLLLLPSTTAAATISPRPPLPSTDLIKLLNNPSSASTITSLTFSGPLLEQCTGALTDGTTFTVTGLREDPTSPESPLKLMAVARDRSVKYGIEIGGVDGKRVVDNIAVLDVPDEEPFFKSLLPEIKLPDLPFAEERANTLDKVKSVKKKSFKNDRVKEAEERSKLMEQRRIDDEAFINE